MNPVEQKIEEFFDLYALRFNASLSGGEVDADKVAQNFADCFIEASPLGVNSAKNNEQFKESIPKGYEFYKRIGITAMHILSKEITLLDPYHAMVKILWESKFIRKDGSSGEVSFDVFYFLQILKEDLKIFAYITGDEQAVLKQEGLI